MHLLRANAFAVAQAAPAVRVASGLYLVTRTCVQHYQRGSEKGESPAD